MSGVTAVPFSLSSFETAPTRTSPMTCVNKTRKYNHGKLSNIIVGFVCGVTAVSFSLSLIFFFFLSDTEETPLMTSGKKNNQIQSGKVK